MLQGGLGLEDRDIQLGNIDLGQDLVLLHVVAAVHLEFLKITRDLGVERGALESSNRSWLIGDPLCSPPFRLDDLRSGNLLARRL